MTLQPSATVQLGRREYATHPAAVSVTLATLPAVDRADVRFPVAVPIDARPGDDAVLRLDGGDGGALVLSGTIRMVHRDVMATTVTLGDAGAALAAHRPSVTFESQTPGDALRRLAGDAGVSVGRVERGPTLPVYVADQRRTAAEHAARLAALAGAVSTVAADGRLESATRPSGRADLALRYGRELTRYTVTRSGPRRQAPVAVGHGPSTPGRTDALVPTTDALTGGAPRAGADAHWRPDPSLRSPAAVEAATRGLRTGDAARGDQLTAETWLLPALRPGQLVAVQDLPASLPAGPWFVTRVHHVLAPDGAGWTAVRADVGGDLLSGLLEAAHGVIGGLR
jgi:hypothetical protein